MHFFMKRRQRAHMPIAHKDNIATMSPITPIRATQRHMRFTAETDHTVSTITTAHIYFSLIIKHNFVPRLEKRDG
jgi:hypothetical protein